MGEELSGVELTLDKSVGRLAERAGSDDFQQLIFRDGGGWRLGLTTQTRANAGLIRVTTLRATDGGVLLAEHSLVRASRCVVLPIPDRVVRDALVGLAQAHAAAGKYHDPLTSPLVASMAFILCRKSLETQYAAEWLWHHGSDFDVPGSHAANPDHHRASSVLREAEAELPPYATVLEVNTPASVIELDVTDVEAWQTFVEQVETQPFTGYQDAVARISAEAARFDLRHSRIDRRLEYGRAPVSDFHLLETSRDNGWTINSCSHESPHTQHLLLAKEAQRPGRTHAALHSL